MFPISKKICWHIWR